MSSGTCPANTHFIDLGLGQTTTLCYQDCPAGYTGMGPSYMGVLLDPTICYQEQTCTDYPGLLDDANDTLCAKDTEGTPSPPCPAGYTQYGSSCYIRCPLSMLENSNTCIKRQYIRAGYVPICEGTKLWNGSTCVSVSGGGGSSGSSAPPWFYIALISLLGSLVFVTGYGTPLFKDVSRAAPLLATYK